MRRIYLDHNATTRPLPAVVRAMADVLSGPFGNPASLHRYGQDARRIVDRARGQVATRLACAPEEVVFTSGGTEANNLAVLGMARRAGQGRILASAVEHPSVTRPLERLAAEGFDVQWLPVDGEGVARLDVLEDLLRPGDALLCLMLANHETGSLQPVREAAVLARERGIPVFCDAVQALGKMTVHPRELGVDLLSVSAHKVGGPKGTGALYVRRGLQPGRLVEGGHQEWELRPGTEDVAGLAGFGVACEACGEGEAWARAAALRDRFEAGILERVEGVRVNGPRNGKRLDNTTDLAFEGLEGEALVVALDLDGVAVSAGAACSAGQGKPSPVLLAMGCDETTARSAIRVSLGTDTEDEEIGHAVDVVVRAVKRLRAAGGRWS